MGLAISCCWDGIHEAGNWSVSLDPARCESDGIAVADAGRGRWALPMSDERRFDLYRCPGSTHTVHPTDARRWDQSSWPRRWSHIGVIITSPIYARPTPTSASNPADTGALTDSRAITSLTRSGDASTLSNGNQPTEPAQRIALSND